MFGYEFNPQRTNEMTRWVHLACGWRAIHAHFSQRHKFHKEIAGRETEEYTAVEKRCGLTVDLAVDTKKSDRRSMAFVFGTFAAARLVVKRVDFVILEKC